MGLLLDLDDLTDGHPAARAELEALRQDAESYRAPMRLKTKGSTMDKNRESAFGSWFAGQYTPRTASGLADKPDEQLRSLVKAGQVAELVLARREAWDEKQAAALYAWCASGRAESTP